MSDTLFDISQYQSPAHINYSPDWRDATGTDPAWEQPELEPDLGTNPQVPADDALNQWRREAEFTLTLQSGHDVEVTFVPCLIGDRRMHEFSFTGPVSSTGFKSHFVLAVESEQFPYPRDYAQVYAEEIFARFEAGQQQQAKSKKRSRPMAEAQTPQSQATDNDSSRQETTMAADQTDVLNYARVEVVEELSPEEEADRQRLELKVERAFYESGKALSELRSRRLYRSTHRKFEEYCRDRFGFTRAAAYYLISAAEVMNNLISECQQIVDILPTKENQCRPLAKLEPEAQAIIWQKAVAQVGGKVPPARIVKDLVMRHMGIVEDHSQKNPSSTEFVAGDVVEIKALKRSPLHPFDGMWATIEHVGSFSYMLRLGIAKDLQQCKEGEMTKIDHEYTADIIAVQERIELIVQSFEMEQIEYDIIENLQRSKFFTPRQLRYLEMIERDHEIKSSPGNKSSGGGANR